MSTDTQYSASSDINIVVDSYNSIENGMMQRYFSKKYSFPIEGLVTSPDRYKDIIEELKTLYSIKEYNFDTSATNKLMIVEDDYDQFMMISRSGIKNTLIIDVYAINIEVGEKVFNLTKKYEDCPSMTTIKIISFSIGGSGQLERSTTTKNQDDFKTLSKLYYPFLDTDEMFKQYLISNDNLLLLAGETGSGKTKIIDMILDFCIKNENLIKDDTPDEESEDDSIFVAYVKNPSILAMDSFWNTLSKTNFNFVVLDDIDNALTDRSISSGSQEDDTRKRFISNFLSYTDGIFSTKTKFIITTNQNVDNIDKAILRKGRCFDVLSFRPLSIKEAEEVWLEAELPIEKFNEEFSSYINIAPADLGSKIELLNNMLGKNTTIKASYIKEEGISLYKTNFKKKITI